MEPSQLATEAMRREWTSGADQKATELIRAESEMEYREVARLCRVIDADTGTVVIDRGLVASIRLRRRVARTELQNHSVQIWGSKIERLGLEELPGGELYAWNDAYDPEFLGYMVAVLRNEEFLRAGGTVV